MAVITHYSLLITQIKYDNCLTGHDITGVYGALNKYSIFLPWHRYILMGRNARTTRVLENLSIPDLVGKCRNLQPLQLSESEKTALGANHCLTEQHVLP